MFDIIYVRLSQICVVYVVDLSIILILYLSAAHGNLHELSSLVVLTLMVMWPLGSCLGELAELILSLLGHNIVGGDLFLHLSEGGVLVHCGLSDRNNCFHNVPKDSLHKRSGRQGPGVGESSVKVNQLNEFLQVKGAISRVVSVLHLHLFVHLFVDQGSEELVVPVDVWVLSFS